MDCVGRSTNVLSCVALPLQSRKVSSEMAAETELTAGVFLKDNLGWNCRHTEVILQTIIANVTGPIILE